MNQNIVAVKKCKTYDEKEVKTSLKSLLEELGGIEAFVSPGDKVLIKPNMLSCKNPDRAATTHPAVIEALAELCFNAHASEVWIGDSPPAIFGKTEEFWETTGFAKAAKNSGAKLVSFEASEKAPVNFHSNGKDLTAYVTELIFKADCVINLSKMKTHNLTRITGAVKNNFGFIPGFSKGLWHKTFPKAQQFAQFITDYARSLPVDLNIMDAVSAMDLQGPASGRTVYPGLLLASPSPVALDYGFCGVIGLEPSQVPYLAYCQKIGWGPGSPENLLWVGDKKDEVKVPNYKVPPTPPTALIPEAFINAARKMVRSGPSLTGKCIKCRRCENICPAKAITVKNSGAEFDMNKCISCFCCMEVCPAEAITMKLSPLVRMFMKLKKLIP